MGLHLIPIKCPSNPMSFNIGSRARVPLNPPFEQILKYVQSVAGPKTECGA